MDWRSTPIWNRLSHRVVGEIEQIESHQMLGITQTEATVLFIDDESKVLDGLRRMLRPLRHEWRMTFVEGASEALRLLAATSFDVVVTEIQMRELSGNALL